ncbi:MAG: hypothetical protein K2X02_06475 [Alphaproteobacteria bacterium]|nr:hypothetical protein [Alphaproteobacteria bacterium]
MSNRNNLSLRLLRLILGYFFLLIGMIGIFIPLLQGWLFIILGLLLLKGHAKWVKTLNLWVSKKYPKSRSIIRRLHKTINDWLSKLGLS